MLPEKKNSSVHILRLVVENISLTCNTLDFTFNRTLYSVAIYLQTMFSVTSLKAKKLSEAGLHKNNHLCVFIVTWDQMDRYFLSTLPSVMIM